MCVIDRTFFRCVILLVTQFILVLLIFQFIYYLPLCFCFITSFQHIYNFLLSLLPLIFFYIWFCKFQYILNLVLAAHFFSLWLSKNRPLFTGVFSSFIDPICPESLRCIVLAEKCHKNKKDIQKNIKFCLDN